MSSSAGKPSTILAYVFLEVLITPGAGFACLLVPADGVRSQNSSSSAHDVGTRLSSSADVLSTDTVVLSSLSAMPRSTDLDR